MLPEWYILSLKRSRRTAMEDDRHWKFTLATSIVVFLCYQRCIFSRDLHYSLHCFNVGTKWPWRVESWTVSSAYRLIRTTWAVQWRRVSDCLRSPWRHFLLRELLTTARKYWLCKMVSKSCVAHFFDSAFNLRSSSLSQFPGNSSATCKRASGRPLSCFWAQSEIAWHK